MDIMANAADKLNVSIVKKIKPTICIYVTKMF